MENKLEIIQVQKIIHFPLNKMNINAVENLGNSSAAQTAAPSQDALRRAAAQFEAILLMQLTSALNGANNDDEDSLFGSDGGSSLAKQMFSEQLATTMAESGGIGLSDIILRQFGAGSQKKPAASEKLAGLVSAVKDIKPDVSSNQNVAPLINKNGKIEPVTNTFKGDPNDAEIISRFEDQYKNLDAAQNPASDEKTVKRAVSQFMPDFGNVATNSAYASNAGNISFQLPVDGRISSGFGNRIHPIDRKVKFHAGLDIAAPKGTPIGASAEGIVTFAGWRKGYGNLVIIEHPDGRTTRYGHAAKLFVNEGDIVSAGQPIASVGSTGKSTGPHLHFEVRENDKPVDPRRFLSNVLPKPADR